MNAHESFLRAIADAPDDLALRQVYADWLEENGEADRAEFIRVQCALADPCLARSVRQRLKAREQELLEAHRKRWLGRLRRSPLPWVFHRGFLALSESGVFRTGTTWYRGDSFCDYLRFYPDGRLLFAELSPAPGTLRALDQELQWGNRYVEPSTYTLEVTPRLVVVRFKTGTPGPQRDTEENEGTIQGRLLRLEVRTLYEGSWLNPIHLQYQWVQLPTAP